MTLKWNEVKGPLPEYSEYRHGKIVLIGRYRDQSVFGNDAASQVVSMLVAESETLKARLTEYEIKYGPMK